MITLSILSWQSQLVSAYYPSGLIHCDIFTYPSPSHLEVALYVAQYLANTKTLGITLPVANGPP
jgi:hypothetical protein